MSEIIICGHCESMELILKENEGRYHIKCTECESVGADSDTKNGAWEEWVKGDPTQDSEVIV